LFSSVSAQTLSGGGRSPIVLRGRGLLLSKTQGSPIYPRGEGHLKTFSSGGEVGTLSSFLEGWVTFDQNGGPSPLSLINSKSALRRNSTRRHGCVYAEKGGVGSPFDKKQGSPQNIFKQRGGQAPPLFFWRGGSPLRTMGGAPPFRSILSAFFLI